MARLRNKQTIVVMGLGDIYETNRIFIDKPSSNCKIVKIKKDRICRDCNNLIKKENKCYTFNNKKQGRTWVCFSCLSEPGKEDMKQIGEEYSILYSEKTDSLGRHKTLKELNTREYNYFEEKRLERIYPNVTERRIIMNKKTILKKCLKEEIASYLRPIIRKKADIMLSTKTPQHGFTKKGQSTIGVTVKFSENYITQMVIINFRDRGLTKQWIIDDLNKEDWISYYKSHQTIEDLVDKVYFKISRSKKLPEISRIEILDKVKQIYGN